MDTPRTTLRRLSNELQRGLIWVVLAIGFSTPLGMTTGIGLLQSVGSLLPSSPMPAVFHYEAIAARVVVEASGGQGESAEFEMGPARFSRLRGPMTRRAVYTFPVFLRLPREASQSIYRYGICRRGPLARELEFPFEVLWAELRIVPRTPRFERERRFEIPCL